MKKNYKIILLFCLLLGGMLSDASAKRKNSFVRKDEIFSYYSKFVSEVGTSRGRNRKALRI